MTRSLFRICFNSLFFFSPTNGQDICPVVQIDPNARTFGTPILCYLADRLVSFSASG